MDLFRRLLFWTGLPLVLPQGALLRMRAPRSTAAAGADHGVEGEGPPLRLLALGDSIIAGVGAEVSEAALPARFAAELGARIGHTVHWRALGKIGATAHQVQHRLLPQIGTGDIDVVLLSVGINDVTGLHTRAAFKRNLVDVLRTLHGHSPKCRVVLVGLPPLHGFPRLPQPLRFLFGQRARSFDLILQQLAQQRRMVLHAPGAVRIDPHQFAADGFHPNAASHARWAADLATATVARWTTWEIAPPTPKPQEKNGSGQQAAQQ